MSELPFAESYKIKVVENLHRGTREEREQYLKEANYIMFQLKSEGIYIDLLSDSGTGALSDRQWSVMMKGDESYAGSSSYLRLAKAVKDIIGYEYFLPAHQGRGAENVLLSCLMKEGSVVPGNSIFSTTRRLIEHMKGSAVNCHMEEVFDAECDHNFKGNVDLKKLKSVLSSEQVPLVVITVTCNTTGGQPVSMENIRAVSHLAKEHGVPVCIDAARFASNAYFIKTREPGYQDKTIREISKEMFSYADFVTMSAKKDAVVNIGGFLAIKSKDMYAKAQSFTIVFEGYLHYGGMAGRDMEAMVQGLEESTTFEFQETRMKQMEFLGQRLEEYKVPFLKPVGGHSVCIDASSILRHIPQEEMRAETLACEVYLEGGIRGKPFGTLTSGRDPVTLQNIYPRLETLQLYIPRRTYTNSHMTYVAAVLGNVVKRASSIKHGLKILYEPEIPILRYYTARLDKVFAVADEQ